MTPEEHLQADEMWLSRAEDEKNQWYPDVVTGFAQAHTALAVARHTIEKGTD